MSKQRVIDVNADWVGLEGPTLMGHLIATPARGKEVFAFEYDKGWLSTASRQQLDPSLDFYGGLQYPAKDRENFAVFLDSSPDRWGRVQGEMRVMMHVMEGLGSVGGCRKRYTSPRGNGWPAERIRAGWAVGVLFSGA
jgi:serine/threonine-protein kinase HipA